MERETNSTDLLHLQRLAIRTLLLLMQLKRKHKSRHTRDSLPFCSVTQNQPELPKLVRVVHGYLHASTMALDFVGEHGKGR